MTMFSCDRHDRMMIVHSELICPLCKYITDTEEAREHAEEALSCLKDDDLVMELSDVADKLVTSMEKLSQ